VFTHSIIAIRRADYRDSTRILSAEFGEQLADALRPAVAPTKSAKTRRVEIYADLRDQSDMQDSINNK
jgi:hypothetical protein